MSAPHARVVVIEGGGHVAVVLERDEGGFRLRVEDDGPGVPIAELPRLGERTFRSDEARRRDPRGSGLGLAITTEVCERCGWALSFESAAPSGLVVSFGEFTEDEMCYSFTMYYPADKSIKSWLKPALVSKCSPTP